MNLEDMIKARAEKDLEAHGAAEERLVSLHVRLAAILGGVDRTLMLTESDTRELRAGLEAIRGQMAGLLEEEGIDLIGATGEVIDPARHAVQEMRQQAGDGPPQVIEVLSYGAQSKVGERLLARARVVASVSESEPEE